MPLPLLLPSLSFVIRDKGRSALDSRKSFYEFPGLQILQKIASALSRNGYRISRLKRRSASVAILRCSKGDLRVGMILSAAVREGGACHCDLDIWRIHSIFDGQSARRRRIQRDLDLLRELYCVIERQIQAAFEIDGIRWAAGTRGLPLIGSDGRPKIPASSNEHKAIQALPINAGAE